MSFCLKLFLLHSLPSGQWSIKVFGVTRTQIPIPAALGSHLISQSLCFLAWKRRIITTSEWLPLIEHSPRGLGDN